MGDENPASISSKELKLYIKQGNINYLGDIKSVQLILKTANFMFTFLSRSDTSLNT